MPKTEATNDNALQDAWIECARRAGRIATMLEKAAENGEAKTAQTICTTASALCFELIKALGALGNETETSPATAEETANKDTPGALKHLENNVYGKARTAPEIVSSALDEYANAALANAAALRFVLQEQSADIERGGRVISATAQALENMAENMQTAANYLWECA